ncbi:hypothetical protein BGZ65_012279, partial [Modicella reniformis]
MTAAVAAGFHSSSTARNNSEFSGLLSSLRSSNINNSNTSNSSNSSGSSNNSNNASTGTRTTSSLFGSTRSSGFPNSTTTATGAGAGARRNDHIFGFSNQKANTTSNPIHLDIDHPTEGRSFRVLSPTLIDQTYRKLRTSLNQSNMKREIRLKRTHETPHIKMRRERQERNKKLFGALVRKKIDLIKLIKSR